MMRGLSLIQPWASAVAVHLKHVETRKWHTDHRGLIAVCSTKDDRPAPADLTRRVTRRWGRPLPHGRIVAVARLVDCVRTDDITWTDHHKGWWTLVDAHEVDGVTYGPFYAANPAEKEWGDYRSGRWAWLLADITHLSDPVPVQGRQGLWTVDDDTCEAVCAQIGANR